MNYLVALAHARAQCACDMLNVLACYHKASHFPPGSAEFLDLWESVLGGLELLAHQEILGPLDSVDTAPIEHEPDLVRYYEQFRDEHLALCESPDDYFDC